MYGTLRYIASCLVEECNTFERQEITRHFLHKGLSLELQSATQSSLRVLEGIHHPSQCSLSFPSLRETGLRIARMAIRWFLCVYIQAIFVHLRFCLLASYSQLSQDHEPFRFWTVWEFLECFASFCRIHFTSLPFPFPI